MRLLRQVVMLVEKDGETFAAHWIEYPHGAGSRTHLAVLDYQPTLLPRGKVALAWREAHDGCDLQAARALLGAAGYRIVGELAAGSDSPSG
ncbi:hypothetical protein [Nannocystis punicea]|uniref:Uncharacterized protein n=1 Tax=Nannocystis punicea TaxID=2995304 RepID=A0ABY7H9L5_9BACT|nr:hypothetical protein [Nannocystis poenicansa]WAS95967.1 hypothetical protein O0S08_07360 [Nannocystis poenicansa]